MSEATTTTDTLEKLIAAVEQKADKLGWDMPNQVLVVAGSEEDPKLEPLLLTPDHLPTVLEALVKSGHEIIDEALGLALCTEAWRYATMQEAVAAIHTPAATEYPRLVDTHTRLFDPESNPPLDVQKEWLQACAEIGKPSDVPDWLHREIRMASIVMRSGATVVVTHTRGEEASKPMVAKVAEGRLIEAARKFLGM